MRRALVTLLGIFAGLGLLLPIVHGQTIPGSPFGGSSGGGGVSWPVSDDTFSVDDGGDGNELKFQLSSLTADRTYTWPDNTGSVAVSSATNVFTAHQRNDSNVNLYFGPANDTTSFGVRFNTSQTPDTPSFALPTSSNALMVVEAADAAADCAHALQTNPTLFIHSATICSTSTTQFAAFDHLGVQPNRVTVTVDTATTFAITTGYVVLECTGAETINTITGATRAGAILYLENSDTECTIADDDSATASNAIDLIGTATTDVGAVAKVLTLVYNGSHWLQMSESDN